MSKRCSKCLEVKSLNEFTPQPINADGLSGTCIACDREEKGASKKYKRPVVSVMRKVDELLSLSMDHYLIAQKIIDLAIDGDKEMIKFIVERQDGKVKDNVSIEMSGEVINTNVQVVATANELREKIRGQLQAPKQQVSTPNQTANNGTTPTTH